MTEEEQWLADVQHAQQVLTELCQSVIDDTYEIVQCRADSGQEFIGYEVGGRVIAMVIPQDIPQTKGPGVLQ